jgi:uncharacterized membrane protein
LSVNPKRAGIVDGMFLTAQGFFSKIYCHDVLAWHKRRQLFISTHDETLSVVAIRVNNPDRSPLRFNG